MINATLDADPKSGLIRITAAGHAGAGKNGEDIICAAASMITMTIAQHIKNVVVCANELLAEEPVIKLEKGDSVISFVCANADAYLQLFRDMVVVATGYALLAGNHKDFVKVDLRGDFKSKALSRPASQIDSLTERAEK